MIEYISTKIITSAILAPAINSALSGAKKLGVKGLHKWEQSKFHSKIQKKIASIESLKTFWSADKLVSLMDFYYPSKIDINDERKHCQHLSELPTGNLIIEGIVGQGKSIYLRHLATSEIRSNQSHSFPIFVEFRTLTKNIDLELAIKNYLDDVNINGFDPDTFEYVMSSGKFVLLLDAFDEIDEQITKETYFLLDRYCDKYEKLKIIITSRPSAEIQKSPKFRVLKLSTLRESDYSPFLNKLGLDSILIAEIKISIKNSPSKVSQLITTPLMLTLVVLAYRSVKEIPENLPDFFEILFKCVFSGHDNAKPYIKRTLATELSEKKLQELFEAFCFVCLKNKVIRSLSTTQFDIFFEAAKKLLGFINCESVDFRQDMNKVACLILPDGFENWVFLHKSIMEYYAGSFVKKSNEDFVKKFYGFAMRDPGLWMEVLTFLNYIDEYRFQTYYLLPELVQFLSDVSFIENEATSLKIVEYVEKMGLDVLFSLNLEEGFNPVFISIGGGKVRFCNKEVFHEPFLRYFISGLKVIDNEFMNFLSKSSAADQKLSLSFRQAIKLYGDNDVIADFIVMKNKMKRKETLTIENITLHESRCNFLDD